MEIYSFEFGIFINIIYALMAIGMAVVTAFVIKLVIQQVRKESKSRLKRAFVFMPFIIIPLIFSILFGGLFAKYATFDYNMSKDNASFLEGDVEIISLEEKYYRGRFLGYNVVIKVGEQRISPSNVFSKDIVNAFESDQTLIVKYDEVKNDGTYIGSIKLSD